MKKSMKGTFLTYPFAPSTAVFPPTLSLSNHMNHTHSRKSFTTPSRIDLLIWLNNLLNLDYIRIQQCADGIAYALVLNFLHPGKIPLESLNFQASTEYDFIQNLKIIANCIKKLNLSYAIELEKLAKGSMHSHYDFLKWLYNYYQNSEQLRILECQDNANISKNFNFYADRRVRENKNQRNFIKCELSDSLTKNISNTSNNVSKHSMKFLSHENRYEAKDNEQNLKDQGVNENVEDVSQVSSVEDMLESCLDVIIPLKQIIYERLKNQEAFYNDLMSLKQERDFYFEKLECLRKAILTESMSDNFLVEILRTIREKPKDF